MSVILKKIGTFTLLSLAVMWAGCSSDSDKPVDTDSEPGSTDDTESESASEKETDTGPDKCEDTEPTVAIDLDFNDWEQGDSRFYMSKPDQGEFEGGSADLMIYDDNATGVSIDGHEAIMLHADAVDNDGYGFSIEGQWTLDQQTDMRCENFEISFDLYVPAALKDESKNANVQFALYETTNYTPIYSKWWSTSLEADKWVTITGKIDTNSGDIDYTDFADNPGEWIFDAVRIQLILNGEGAALGDEMTFYVDNLRVANTPDEGDTDTETETEDTDDMDGGMDTEDTEDTGMGDGGVVEDGGVSDAGM